MIAHNNLTGRIVAGYVSRSRLPDNIELKLALESPNQRVGGENRVLLTIEYVHSLHKY